MTWSLFLTLPFLFCLLPKGVILLVERSVPFSTGLHSVTSQPERDGPKSRAPVLIREQLTFHLPCTPVRCPSSPHSKRVTLRRGMWTPVSGTKGGSSSGTPRRPVRQRCPSAILPHCPVRLSCWQLVLYPTVLALLPPSQLHWSRRRISALHKQPVPLKLV